MILHIPHSSLHIPFSERKGIQLTDEDLKEELYAITDLYTDCLFYTPKSRRLIYPYSRLVVDPERFLDEMSEPMVAKGMGARYTHTSRGMLFREESEEQKEKSIKTYYHPYHDKFAKWVEKELKKKEICVIVDCHSFSDIPLPYENNHITPRPDICIGTDYFHTKQELLDIVLESFAKFAPHYKVDEDNPYSGSIVPSYYSNITYESGIQSIMIEVNKKLYIQDDNQWSEGFFDLQNVLTKVLNEVEKLDKKWYE